MDVNSIANSSNLLKAYATAEGTQTQYTNANINSGNSEVKEVQKIQQDGDKENRQNDKSYDKKDLDKALKKLNKFLEDERTRAEYSYHKELGTLMIKVIDEDTNKTILEIPPKKVLDMVAYLCEQVGLIDKKA